MRIAALLLLLPLAACDGGAGDDATRGEASDPLTGRYVGSADRDRLCFRKRPSGEIMFGLATLSPDGDACAGIGQATRRGKTIRLTMTGEGECEIEATTESERVVFPDRMPEGCDYYCSPDATLADAQFERTASGIEAARTTLDFVGDPLCSDVWNAPAVRPAAGSPDSDDRSGD